MMIGTLQMKMSTGIAYGPTFSRGGLGAVFSAEVLDMTSGVSGWVLTVEHKNAEDTSFTTLGSLPTFAGTGVQFDDFTGIKEQLRFKYTITASNEEDAVLFNVLAPAWKPY